MPRPQMLPSHPIMPSDEANVTDVARGESPALMLQRRVLVGYSRPADPRAESLMAGRGRILVILGGSVVSWTAMLGCLALA